MGDSTSKQGSAAAKKFGGALSKLTMLRGFTKEPPKLTKGQQLRARTKSEPALWLRPPTPEGEVKHLHKWLGPDRTLCHFSESTPWERVAENNELVRRMRTQPAFRSTDSLGVSGSGAMTVHI